MRRNAGILFIAGLLMVGGLAAAGCGSDDSTDTTTTGTAVAPEGDAAEGASPDQVYADCKAALEDTSSAGDAGQAACEKTRDAFQKCIDTAAQLDGDAKKQALKACQSTADGAIERISGE